MAQIPNMNWMGNEPTGSAYDVYQYYLGGGSPGGTTPTSGGGITSLPLPLYPPTGGGNDGYKGGGIWGNLDLSKGKTFTKDVWSQAGPPNQMDWVSKDVQGYYNPTLGQYQTLGGKNINHLGINVPSMAGMLLDKNWGKTMPGDIKGTFTEGWDKGLENIKEGTEEWFEAIKNKVGWGKKKAKKALDHKKHVAALELKEKEKQKRKDDAAKKSTYTGPKTYDHDPSGPTQADIRRDRPDKSGKGHSGGFTDPGKGSYGPHKAEGGMITDFNKDPEYRGWKKMYEANPEIGSMHEKHPTFIKFYKQHERDKKKFGGLAGLLYG